MMHSAERFLALSAVAVVAMGWTAAHWRLDKPRIVARDSYWSAMDVPSEFEDSAADEPSGGFNLAGTPQQPEVPALPVAQRSSIEELLNPFGTRASRRPMARPTYTGNDGSEAANEDRYRAERDFANRMNPMIGVYGGMPLYPQR